MTVLLPGLPRVLHVGYLSDENNANQNLKI